MEMSISNIYNSSLIRVYFVKIENEWGIYEIIHIPAGDKITTPASNSLFVPGEIREMQTQTRLSSQ